MPHQHPSELCIIAGKGAYPILLAEAAKRHGVKRVAAVAFRKETDRRIESAADEVHWVYLGQFRKMLEVMRQTGIRQAVMAGQITPTHLFRIRPDTLMLDLLRSLPVKNAETIFGAVGDQLNQIGIELQPAHLFMQDYMPAAGLLTSIAPTEVQEQDIALGLHVAKSTSSLDIGQTVVIKEGTILAVEAFEGTNATIRRAAKLGGEGIVVVKVAKEGHDMRFDIPVVGMHTMKLLKRARAGALAVEANRTILLEKDAVIAEANRMGLCIIAQ